MTKEFDAVEMKRAGAAKVAERLARMSREEQLEYWRRRTEELRTRQESDARDRKRTA